MALTNGQNQENLSDSHGKNISFKDWADDEGLKHGNTEITDWAQHEDESHDARYGAEGYRVRVFSKTDAEILAKHYYH